MRKKTEVEKQRNRISQRIRAEATILRAEYLDEVLPAALAEFDRRVAGGEPMEIQPVDIKALIAGAVADVTA